MTRDDWNNLKAGDLIRGPAGVIRAVVHGPGDYPRPTVCVRKIRKSWAKGSPNTYLYPTQARLYEIVPPTEHPFIGEGI